MHGYLAQILFGVGAEVFQVDTVVWEGNILCSSVTFYKIQTG